jgi:hypothetical protein
MKTFYIKVKLVFLFIVLFLSKPLSAQTPEDATVTLSPDSGNMVMGLFYVLLPDTNNLEAVSIQLGSARSDSNLVNYTFNFDVNTGLPNGFSWDRQGLKLYLNVGIFPLSDLRFGKVKLRRSGQVWGNEYAFISN